MIQDEGLRQVRTAFKLWAKVCIQQAMAEFNEMKSKDTIKR